MARVIIDGQEYCPFIEFEKIDDESIKKCIKELVSIQYFNIKHKNRAVAWNALNHLSSNLALLVSQDKSVAYDLLHGTEDDCNDYGQEDGDNGEPEYIPKVTIDGIQYIPKNDFKLIDDSSIIECLKELVSLQYFNEEHKNRAVAWDALNALDPEIAELCATDMNKISEQFFN